MDYALIGVGGAASVVTAIDLNNWGSEVIVSCLYDPLGTAKPYKLVFGGCGEVRCSVHEEGALEDTSADLIGFSIGENDLRKPAIITTDVFELSILYRTFQVEK